MIGRNELCPCGSGKKYKKCCMNKDVISERAMREVETLQKRYSDLYTKIYNFAQQEKYRGELKKVREIFYVMDDEDINSKFEVFFNTYFLQDHIMENKKVITVEFFEANKDNLTQSEIDILTNLFESYLSVFEIKEITDGKVVLEDCMTGVEVTTADVNLLRAFKSGSYIIARPVKVGDMHLLIDITLSITAEVKDVVVNDLNNLYSQYANVYNDVKVFLIYHTNIIYKYIQQLLDGRVADYLRAEGTRMAQEIEKKAQDREVQSKDVSGQAKYSEVDPAVENSEAVSSVSELLLSSSSQNITSDCVSFWEDYRNNNEDVDKYSDNSWAAAVEYYMKKENGEVATQSEIAKKYGTSAGTLGKRYKDIKSSVLAKI
ncbi:MAG: SEC-C domain-containing protein [Clostridioides sp.]|nr:SEC-C domain-containing protein [Clostridioides sp.]